jgi:hypothetical protein
MYVYQKQAINDGILDIAITEPLHIIEDRSEGHKTIGKLLHKCFELLCSLLMPFGLVNVFYVGYKQDNETLCCNIK